GREVLQRGRAALIARLAGGRPELARRDDDRVALVPVRRRGWRAGVRLRLRMQGVLVVAAGGRALPRLLVRVALGDLEQDGGDVVVAAAVVRLLDQRPRGRAQVVAVAREQRRDRLAVDHGREAVRAEQE